MPQFCVDIRKYGTKYPSCSRSANILGITIMVLAISLVCLAIDVIQTGTYFGVCLNGMTEILLNCKVAVLIPPSVQVHRLTLVTLLYLVADLINVTTAIYISMPAPLTGHQAAVCVIQIWIYSSASHNGNIQY